MDDYLITIAVLITYFSVLYQIYNRTIGELIFRLQTISTFDDHAEMRQIQKVYKILGVSLTYFVPILILSPLFLKGRTFSDMISSTKVIRKIVIA